MPIPCQGCPKEELVRGMTWADLAQGEDGMDPVTIATIRRDGYRCQGCGARRDLQRHSHLKTHTCASVGDCVTLCSECHALFHAEKATIEWLGDGKVRFIRK